MTTNTNKMDAFESAFFVSQFGAASVAVYQKKYPQLIGRSLVPVDNTPSLQDVFSWRSEDVVGTARISAAYTDDAPSVDIVAGPEEFARARIISDSFRWDLAELRRARALGEDIYGKKLSGAREKVERAIDKMLLFGFAPLNALGLFTQTGTATHTMPGAFATLTAAEALSELNEFRDSVGVATKGIHDMTTIVMPATVKSYLGGLLIPNTSISVMKHFQESNPQIEVIGTHLLEANGPIGAINKMVGYQKSEEVLNAWIPQEFEALEPQPWNFGMTVSCHARVTPVAVRFPKAICYASGV